MKLARPIQLIDFRPIFPLDGEDRFEMDYINGELVLNIYYLTNADMPVKRELRFRSASYFLKTPFPGVSFFNCPDESKLDLLDSLVTYQSSEWLDAIRLTRGSSEGRHYRLFLHSVGIAIHVLAASHELSEPEPAA